jgi:hypothetical protein
MKTLRIFGAALLAMTLAACGSSNTNPYMNGYNPYSTNGYNNYNMQGGCQPLQQGTFSFTAQGAQMDSTILLAGNVSSGPHYGNYGQVTMGGMGATGGGYPFSPYMGTNGNITQLTAGQGTLSGTIQLSQGVISNLMAYAYNMGGTTGMNTMGTMGMSNPSICVSSIGLWAVHNNNSIWGATVYIYLSNSQQPFSIML